MAETTIRLNIPQVIEIIREKYNLPEKDTLQVEIVAHSDQTEYASRMQNTMSFRISDANIVHKASRDYTFEYDFNFGAKDRLKTKEELTKFFKKVVENRGFKDVYNNFNVSYNDFKKGD